MEYQILAPAKINLFLDVLDRRADGYHNINSIMQSVNLCDTLTLTTNAHTPGSRNITITSTTTELACDESNLVYRAAEAFFIRAHISSFSLHIHIDKKIPISAGLAGGSTDAAATLIALNHIYGDIFTEEELCQIGVSLGADIPFCIRGNAMHTKGIGEKMTPTSPLDPDIILAVAVSDVHISTPYAYSLLDEKYGTSAKESRNIQEMIDALHKNDVTAICDLLYNKFENVVCPICEPVEKIKGLFKDYGASGTLMSGSGPSVFAIFKKEDALFAQKCVSELTALGYSAFLCHPCHKK